MAKHHSILSVETFTLEGTLFASDDILDRLFKGELDSDYPFTLPPGMSVADECGRAFRIAVAAWKQYQLRREKNQQESERKFLKILFHDALGYDLPEKPEGFVSFRLAGEGTVPIFYSWYEDKFDETDHRFSGDGLSRRKRSVTQYVQEWLNARDDHLWAIATNARLIRLLRDNSSLTRPTYVEFDLERILSEERYPDFIFLWRLLYHDRMGTAPSGDDSVWEKMRRRSESEGVRVFNDLRDGVIRALQILGNAFLKNTRNERLRGAFDSGTITEQAYFEELLLVAYRFLFLYVAEERKLLLFPAPDSPSDAAETYETGYSLHRLTRRALRASAYDRHIDLYESVKIVFAALDHSEKELALPALGGLFRKDRLNWLNGCVLDNRALLEATRALRWTQTNGAYQLVNYRNLGAEELGSVYESLLELVPSVLRQERTFYFVGIPDPLVPAAPARGRRRGGGVAGNARKLTGSYYTPSSLVGELVRTTLPDAFFDARLKGLKTPAEREAALLSIAVLDPACGSGHFLLAAARRIAERLALVRSGEDDGVTPGTYRAALRDVVARCIYGADLNPMAVELAKIALWIETLVPGRPLSFLDAHFACGNSVVGLLNLKQLSGGIPNDAFAVLEGDDSAVCRALAGKNRAVLSSVAEDAKYLGSLFSSHLSSVSSDSAAIDAMPADTLAQIEAKYTAYQALLTKAKSGPVAGAADLLIAAFLLPKTPEDAVPTSADLFGLLGVVGYPEPSPAILQSVAQAVAKAQPLHWPFAFPAVFAKGGFDIILGNPPWDVVQFKEEEFFATRDPGIAALAGNERKTAISRLKESDSALWRDYKDHRIAFEHEKSFYSPNTRFPLSAYGKRNLYALFTELATQLLNPDGRAGLVLQSGIASDDSTKMLFRDLVDSRRLESLFDFENTDGIFPAVHRMFKFCLLTLGRAASADFAFYLHSLPELADKRRHFTLAPSDYALFNPNTLTCPIFRSANDAELAKKIYRKAGVLHRESPSDNPWGIRLWTMFNMTSDSGLFQTVQTPDSLPLYEAKMIDIFDHRYNAFDAPGQEDYHPCSETEKGNPAFEPDPRYWVTREAIIGQFEQDKPIPKYLMGWRDVCRAVDARTTIASVIPLEGVGHTLSLFFTNQPAKLQACLLANFNSLVRDWATRQKVGGLHLSYTYMLQLPTLAPSAYTQEDIDFIVPRVLELTYTSYSLRPWAEALGHSGEPFPWDEERRALLRAELDARYAKLYGLTRDELRYILDPKEATGDPDFPSESFRVLKNDERARFGEYRTRRLVLEAWREQELASIDTYVRQAAPFVEADVRKDYLKFLIRQMLRETGADTLSISEIFSAWVALSDPRRMVECTGMPIVTRQWAEQFKDAIREDDNLEDTLVRMCSDKQISISKSGMVSLRRFPLDESLAEVRDISLDARLALAYCRYMRSASETMRYKHDFSDAFIKRMEEGEFEYGIAA